MIGPFRPCFIDICPEAKLIKHEGIKKGLILFGPFSVKVSLALAMDCKPPIPEPIKLLLFRGFFI